MTIADLPAVSCAIDWRLTWDVVRDIGVLLGTGFAIYAGARGFHEWREIEWAKAEFDISRRLLTSVFKTRDWLNNSRLWMTLTSEYPDGYIRHDATDEAKRDAQHHIFSNRFKPVRDCAIKLQSLRPEAEALWGREIVELTGELLGCCRKLDTAMSAYVRLMLTGDPNGKTKPEAQFENVVYDIPRNVTAANPAGEVNNFTREIADAVEKIENYVRAKQQPIKWYRN